MGAIFNRFVTVSISVFVHGCNPKFCNIYRGADKSLARPDRKNNWKVGHFSSDAEVIAVA